MDWDLADYFPAFDDPACRAFVVALTADLTRLEQAGVPDTPAAWLERWTAYEGVWARCRHLYSYTACLTATDARHEGYLALEAEAIQLGSIAEKVEVLLLDGLGSMDDEQWVTLRAAPEVADLTGLLEHWRERAARRMSTAEESLATELGVDGINAWDRLYGVLSGRLEFTLAVPGEEPRTVPMAERRSLLGDADRAVREAAFTGGNAAWAAQEPVCASAINALAGTRLTLNRRRGVEHFLDVALHQARISRASLEAMLAAIEAEAETVREPLRWRAQQLGLPALSWWDLDAPLPAAALPGGTRLSWEEGRDWVGRAFARQWPELGAYYRDLIERRWIDHTPRPGRRPGGFCTDSPTIGQARIFMTYRGTLGDVMTLAHEAGHAFHSHLLKDHRPFAQDYPMTLAEAASTLAEGLLTAGVTADPAVDPALRRALLDAQVRHAGAFLLDIPMRYSFEHRFHDERARGDVPASRMRELMVEEQRRWFGTALAEGGEDPWFWASKMHFYFAGVTFYNFPYTVGFLLSRGLLERWSTAGAEFAGTVTEFFLRSGTESCEVAARHALGEDLAQPDFWRRAIRGIETDFTALRTAVDQHAGS